MIQSLLSVAVCIMMEIYGNWLTSIEVFFLTAGG
jgi:hypothetical protein